MVQVSETLNNIKIYNEEILYDISMKFSTLTYKYISSYRIKSVFISTFLKIVNIKSDEYCIFSDVTLEIDIYITYIYIYLLEASHEKGTVCGSP